MDQQQHNQSVARLYHILCTLPQYSRRYKDQLLYIKKNRARMFGIISSFNFTMPKGGGWLTDQLADVVVMQYGFFSHPWLCQMCTQPPCHKRISH